MGRIPIRRTAALSPTWQNPAYATAVSTYAAGGNIVKTAAHQPITKSSPQQDQAYLETATITLAGQVQVTTTMEPQWADTAMPA